MTDRQGISALQEEISFLHVEIKSLKTRMGSNGNAIQRGKLDMFLRLLNRCNRDLKALDRRDREGAAA